MTALYRSLDGDRGAPVPVVWWISRLCEEFHCLPSQALAEWRQAPCGVLEQILEARAFAAAKHVVDGAKRKMDIPQTPMTALVQEIEYDMVKERMRERVAQG